MWISPEQRKRKQTLAKAVDKKWKQSPAGQKYMRDYFREYNQLPEQKQYRSEFYKQPHVRAKIRATHKDRFANDLQYRIAFICRSRVKTALRDRKVRKKSKTTELIGCSFDFFRGWIESQFEAGMNWQNYGNKPGQWEVDHAVPIAGFRLEIESELRQAFHYSNCRPMWSVANRAKNDFIQHNGQTLRARDVRKQNIIPFTKAA